MPEAPSLRPAAAADLPAILAVVNEAAEAYRGVIADDCWHEPYMSPGELDAEVAAGVRFWVIEAGDGEVVAAMGLQDVADVTLVRHAYVRRGWQRRGLGARLLDQVRALTDRPVLVGTWRAAAWAVSFYRAHGFRKLDRDATRRLLETYWTVPERQMEESVVLADERWR